MHNKSAKSVRIDFWMTQQSSKCICETRSILVRVFPKTVESNDEKEQWNGSTLRGANQTIYPTFGPQTFSLLVIESRHVSKSFNELAQ
jgi:hypothetical protein